MTQTAYLVHNGSYSVGPFYAESPRALLDELAQQDGWESASDAEDETGIHLSVSEANTGKVVLP